MPKTYSKADDDIREIAEALMDEHHNDLRDAGVRIDFLFAQCDDGPAVTLGGYACAAVVKINSLKDRVTGMGDAQIVLDEEKWSDMSEAERNALLDHELHHLIVREKDGGYERDSHGRPRLKMRKHDRQFGWFDAIAKRHGSNAIEVQQAKTLWDQSGQTYFPFLDETNILAFKPAKQLRKKKAE